MHRRLIAGVAAAASVLALSSSLLLAQDKAASAPGVYKIDPTHSYAIFRITHLGVGANYGAFEKIEGTFEQTAEGVKVDAVIDVESINTFNEARDKHLRGPDFFNSKQYPNMTFKSTASKKTEDGYEVTGDLTVKDITKPVTLNLKKIGEGKGMQGEARTGYETTFTINRLEYGITWNPGAVGNDVSITVAFEAVK